MPLPDIDFHALRDHNGNKANAFEELCCQLASDETSPAGQKQFVRKGKGGDGGVECFTIHDDATETGWQVKYYWDIAAALGALDDSLTKALEKHPAMTRFVACLPIDLSDSRRTDVTTALQRWETWKARRLAQAAAAGRSIEIERWDAFEIKSRLTASTPRAAGRIAFWFDQTLLTPEWFRARLDRTIDTLGKRYSPEAHVSLPIRRAIAAAVRDPALTAELSAYGDAIARGLARCPSPPATAGANITTAASVLHAGATSPETPGLIESLRAAVDLAQAGALTWSRALRTANTGEKPTAAETAVSNLLSTIGSVRRELRQSYWDRLESRALLVVGEAGTGKSHLLADACADHVKQARPALMVLGGKLPDAEPWGEILRDLDLPSGLQAKQFLGALNAAGQAAGLPCLIAIDALNEKNGQAIWPDRLAGLLHDAAQFDWITVVLSCRSTYETVVIPPDLDDEKLPRVAHEGFSPAEARLYLKKRGVSLAEEPDPVEELETPLFLRICCDALAEGGQALLSNGLGGVTETFDLYTKAVTGRVQAQLGTAPGRRIPERILAALAQDMATAGQDELPISRAYDLADPIFNASAIGQDPLFQLENEGLLARDPGERDGEEDVIRFTFQRMSDHAIASSLIERSVAGADVSSACTAGSPLLAALTQKRSTIRQGLLEALAVQLPERFATELRDLPGLPDGLYVDGPFELSLLTRKAVTFTPRTWELVDQVGGEWLRYETLIALSTNPSSAYHARYLDQELRGIAMPDRDARWSTHLAASTQASHLIAWVREADQQAIRADRAELAGLQLCWFLTTSSRSVRDTATKGLVALLMRRADLARALWKQFAALDDTYVSERLAAAIFGAALQGRWAPGDLHSVAEDLCRDVFIAPIVGISALTRDHAHGLVRFAHARGALPPAFPLDQAEPPYTSPWPIEYVTEAEIESFQRVYPSGYRGRDEIASSTVFDGDFARYQLDYAVNDWSVAPLGAKSLPTTGEVADQWLERFRMAATPEMLAAHEVLAAKSAAASSLDHGARRDALEAAAREFRHAVGEQTFAAWRAEAESWCSYGMYEPIARREGEAVPFNLAWARRWVCKRAHDLGWSEALHGAFDRSVVGDRREHKIERIGKKYQWIALSELCARMADNLELLPGRDDRRGVERLRQIDPSMLISQTQDDGWRRFEEAAFWIPPSPSLNATTVDLALAWLSSEADYMDGIDNIEVVDPADDRRWLVLKGFETWRGGNEGLERETWRRIASLVLAKTDLPRLQKLLENIHLQGSDDLPSARSGDFRSYIGEHPWAWRADDPDDDEWEENWRPFESRAKKGVPVRGTTSDYMAESTGYDASLEQNINLHLPAGWLMDALGLELSDGATIKYNDASGVVRFWDPSIALAGRSAALVDRDVFLDYLEREGLALLWAVSGEKNVYGGGDVQRGFGGRWTFTRLFHTDGAQVVAGSCYQTFDPPGADQLAALRDGVESSAEDDDQWDDDAD